MEMRPTEALALKRYEIQAGAARFAVIARTDNWQFFTAAAPARAILHPVNTTLSERQFVALRTAANAIGDCQGFYHHSCERISPPDPETPEDWWISFEVYGAYEQAVAHCHSRKNVLHSALGRWALVMIDSGSVAVGGPAEFTCTLMGSWPSVTGEDAIIGPNQQVEAFLTDLARFGSRSHVVTWLPRFLTHIYRDDEAKRLLDLYLAIPRPKPSRA